MIEIFYLPGLNTYNDDRVHIGPLKFFRMHEVLAEHLGRHRIRLIPIYSDKKNLKDKVEHLVKEINQHQKSRVIVLGHSTGGVIARSFLTNPEIKGKLSGIITFGCPHRGSHLADLAGQLNKNKSSLIKILKLFGYDVTKNINYILDLSSENLAKYFRDEPKLIIPAYSFICTKATNNLPWIFRLLYSYSGQKIDFATDGLVSEKSQHWGTSIGPFNLDHLAQIGFFKHLVNPLHKRQTLLEFDRLIKAIADIVKEINASNLRSDSFTDVSQQPGSGRVGK
ncbi:MAG: hypothetical protein A4S09_11590 [Proteobacteria bacterium SG_bin7]|nr:MAG: hypothetical protein A4S09_11590 [Proteobacteria bacterium SG_bin7]